MRILLIKSSYEGDSDGAARTYDSLIKEFEKEKIEVDVLTLGEKSGFEKRGPVGIWTIKPELAIKADNKPRTDLALILKLRLWKLAHKLSARNYNVIHTGTPEFLGWIAPIIAKKCKCPLVSVYHTNLDEYAKIRASKIFGDFLGFIIGWIVKKYLQWYYNKSDLILAPSKIMKKRVEKYFKPKVEILGRGIDIDKFSPVYRNRKDKKIIILYVGRITPEKNLDWLAEIPTEKNIQLMLVGEGEYKEELKKKLPCAKFTGALHGKKLSQAYANADIFVFPSLTDTFGNVVREAQASGLPVIVTNKGGPKEQVKNGITGFIASSPKKFRESIKKLIENENLRKTISRNARAYASRFSWKKISKDLIKFYGLARKIHKN